MRNEIGVLGPNTKELFKSMQSKRQKLFCKRCMEKIFLNMNSGMHVLRWGHSYRVRTKTEVMKEALGFDKSERGLPYIMVQTSQISQLEVL